MKHHQKCRRLQDKLYRLRRRLELFGAKLGSDDDLFKFQAAFMDMTVQIKTLERAVAEDTWSKVESVAAEDDEWHSVDEDGDTVEPDGVSYWP